MNHPLQRLLAGWAITALLAGGAVWAQTDGSAEHSSYNDEYKLTPAQQKVIEAYVQGRYRRVKATVEHDRAEARRYMSEGAWRQYADKFHPETALAQFKHCATCEEFGVRIIDMVSWCSVFRDGEGKPGTLHCSTTVEMETLPIHPQDATARKMASRLEWHPRGAKPTYDDADDAMKQALGSPEITDDESLVQRMPLGACLQRAASGGFCR
jgi:hypothetical protein